MEIIESLTMRPLPVRTTDVRAVVLHSTGDTELAKILKWYKSADGLQPHWLIGIDGSIFRIVHEDRQAYHAGIKAAEIRHYEMGYQHWSHWVWSETKEDAVEQGDEFAGYRYWRETWTDYGKESPLDLVTGMHPNNTSIGIELQTPPHPGPTIFTDAQYQRLTELLADIWMRHKVPLDRPHILLHSDISPFRRCSEAGPWDPGRNFAINRVFDIIGRGICI